MSLGEEFARAVAGKDRAALVSLLADDVDFKGLTPGRLWEASDAAGVAAIFFDTWFGPDDEIVGLLGTYAGEAVADTDHASYRLDVSSGDGAHVVEQQIYFRAVDGRIGHLRLLCSGYRPQ
ncbi:hypothetical protein [Nocardioides sp.]|uniref:hypothetical protein n=1 Tax=Nocardioides sp. TaxID=35761 RepID=UPI003528FCDC